DLGEQKRAYRSIALGQIELGADAAGFFASHQNVALEHQLANVCEAYSHFMNAAAVTRRDFIEQLGGGESLGQVATDLSRAGEMPEQDGEDLVGSDECAVGVHGPDAIAVSIGGKPGIVATGAHGLTQRRYMGLDGLR